MGAATGRGQGGGRCAPPSPRPPGRSRAARRTKRFSLPPPRPRPRREGESGLQEDALGEEEGEEEGAAGGTGQDRAKEGGQGGGAGRPRRTGRRAGILKAKINKLFLFTCGAGEVGRVGSERGRLASSPPPSRLFVTERRALACGGTAPPPAPMTRRPRTGAIYPPHTARAADRDAVCQGHGQRRSARSDSHRPARCAHPRLTNPGGAVGEGAADTFPSFRPPPPWKESKRT